MIAICDINTYRRLLDLISASEQLTCKRFAGQRDAKGVNCCGVNFTWHCDFKGRFVSLQETQPQWLGFNLEGEGSPAPQDTKNDMERLIETLRRDPLANELTAFFEGIDA